MNKLIIQKPEELYKIALEIIPKLKKKKLLCLYGQLGVGKTTFVQYLVKALSLGAKAKSPSYVIMNIYEGDELRVYHIDFYRLEGQDPYTAVDFDEILSDPQGLVVIEWADLVEKYLPEEKIEMCFKDLGGTTVSYTHLRAHET